MLVILVKVFYVYYLNSVKSNRILAASSWSTAINFSSSVSALFFVQENWIIVPSCFGSFIGTYIGLKLQEKLDKRFPKESPKDSA